MVKKNPYIFTIGFNSKDSEHVEVVRLLNEQGKGKIASFIVKAVLSYMGKTTSSFDVSLVEQILQKMVDKHMESLRKQLGSQKKNLVESSTNELKVEDVISGDMVSIMDNLATFRNVK